MLTKEQLNILGVFKKDIFCSLTFRQVKTQSRQKSNNVVQIALKEFLKEKVLNARMTGDVTVYSLNLENNLTLSYLNIINEQEISRLKFPKDILAEIQNKISKHTEFFILILFGSYAKAKATERSDLDIAVIVESEQTKKDVAPFLETVKRREIKNVDYHLFTRSEFLEMLEADAENLGKQIYKNSIICYGCIQYYGLVRKK